MKTTPVTGGRSASAGAVRGARGFRDVRPRVAPDTRMGAARAAGLLLGQAADRFFGDPRRFHPVAGFGAAASALERLLYADSRPRGAVYTVLLVGSAAGLGAVAERATEGRPLARTAVTALATWAVLGGRSLEREAEAVHGLLAGGDLPGARVRLRSLVGRDTSASGASEVARAAVESVAENTSDAVVAPFVWGSVAGVPGLLAYRAANTLDAMVGHRTRRHGRFGWAPARLDDVLNHPGARLGGLLAAVTVPGRTGAALRAWRRHAAHHPSPNAGVVESAFAGALGVGLGGTNRYGDRTERRPAMGDGRPAGPGDIPRSTALARRVGFAAAAVAAATAVAVNVAGAGGRSGVRVSRRRGCVPGPRVRGRRV